MGAALAWIAGTRIGRALAAAGALVLAVLAALWAARRGGVEAARAEMAERRERAAREAKEIENEVDALGDRDLRSGLRDWMRDHER